MMEAHECGAAHPAGAHNADHTELKPTVGASVNAACKPGPCTRRSTAERLCLSNLQRFVHRRACVLRAAGQGLHWHHGRNLGGMGNTGGKFTMGGMSDMAGQTEREQCAWPPAHGRRRSSLQWQAHWTGTLQTSDWVTVAERASVATLPQDCRAIDLQPGS